MEETLRPLSLAFWSEVMEDLLTGDLMTYLWLYTGETPAGFLWWAEITGKDPESWFQRLKHLWDMRQTEAGERALKTLRKQKESML